MSNNFTILVTDDEASIRLIISKILKKADFTVIEADSCETSENQIINNNIDRLNMSVNSFVISEDSVGHFNQIKGRQMVALFDEGKINKVDVTGNGESLYFVLDDKTNLLMGLNKSICSNITIHFLEGLVNNIMLYVNPEADFIPPHEIRESNKVLKGFNWQGDQKPTKAEVLRQATSADLQAIPSPKKVSIPLDKGLLEKENPD